MQTEDNHSVDPNTKSSEQSGVTGEEIAALKKDLEELKDRHLRSLADMENMRRRFEREKAELIKFSHESILQDLIPVLDSFRQALPQMDETDARKDGFVMVHKQLSSTLAKHGLEEVKAAGQEFNPEVHQAIQRVESDEVESPLIKEEFARGYTLNGRLVRPAMVSVIMPKSADH